MLLSVPCPGCRQPLSVPEYLPGRSVQCPLCACMFTPQAEGPAPDAASPAPSLLEQPPTRAPDAEAVSATPGMDFQFDTSPRSAPLPRRKARAPRTPRGRTALRVALGVSAVLLVCAVAGRFGLLGGWWEYASPEGGFAILMPGGVNQRKKTAETAEELTIPVTVHEARAGLTVYAVAHGPLPPGTAFRADLARQAVEKRKGKVIRDGPVPPLHGYTGHEFEVRTGDGGDAVFRVYEIRGRIYELQVRGRGATASRADVRRFFESFRLVDDLLYVGKVDAFLAAAIDPASGTVLLTTQDGSLKWYSYPDFKPRGSGRLGVVAYEAVLDSRQGLLYAAVANRQNFWGDRGHTRGGTVGSGELHVYDVSAILRGQDSPGANLRPATVIPAQARVAGLFLVPDGRWLYYLDLPENEESWLRRVDTTARKHDGELRLPPQTNVLRLTQDGTTLYALQGSGRHALRDGQGLNCQLQVIDPASLEPRRTVTVAMTVGELPPDAEWRQVIEVFTNPHDLAATDDGRVFVNAPTRFVEAHIVLADAHAGKTVTQVPGPRGAAYLRLSPDGQRLYVADHRGAGRLQCWAVAKSRTGAPRFVTEARTVQGLYQVGHDFVLAPDGQYLLCKTGAVLRLNPVPPRDDRE